MNCLCSVSHKSAIDVPHSSHPPSLTNGADVIIRLLFLYLHKNLSLTAIQIELPQPFVTVQTFKGSILSYYCFRATNEAQNVKA